jgi:hypothetical protein
MIYEIKITTDTTRIITRILPIIKFFTGLVESFGFIVKTSYKTEPTNYDSFEVVVCEEVSKLQGKRVSVNQLESTTRRREVVYSRQIIMKKMNESMSLQLAGNRFGKDHATVLHSSKTVKNMYETNSDYRKMIQRIEERTKCKIY